MKLDRKALGKVEREGNPKVRCQYETNRARGRAWRVKRAEREETMGGATGTVSVQKSALMGLEPVRKGKAAEKESKILMKVLVKTANPLGRMRGETQTASATKQTWEESRQIQETICGGKRGCP